MSAGMVRRSAERTAYRAGMLIVDEPTGLGLDYRRRARRAGSIDHFAGGMVSMVPDIQQLFATGAGGGVTFFNQQVLPDLTNVHAVHWVCRTQTC